MHVVLKVCIGCVHVILAVCTWYWRCARGTGGMYVILVVCTGGVHVVLAVCTGRGVHVILPECTLYWRCARGTGGVHVVLVATAVTCSLCSDNESLAN